MAKFTKNEFRAQFSTEDACLDAIFKLRYGTLEVCPSCNESSAISKVTNRRCYQCSRCHSQFYPTAGTIFEKTRTPLVNWLFVIHLFCTTRNGLAAKEIQRQLGVTYKCAWRMGHQIRKMIGGGFGEEKLSGVVEADETYVGGKAKNMHRKRRKQFKGTGNINKVAVFGMLERGVGVKVKVMNTNYVDGTMLQPIIKKQLKEGSRLITDGHGAYKDLHLKYSHEIVSHHTGEYVRGEDIHTNSIEGFWSQLKRTISGTHIQVSRKYLQLYANECAFRYNNCFRGDKLFYSIMEKIPKVEPSKPK